MITQLDTLQTMIQNNYMLKLIVVVIHVYYHSYYVIKWSHMWI
jgi:hypothetical protein